MAGVASWLLSAQVVGRGGVLTTPIARLIQQRFTRVGRTAAEIRDCLAVDRPGLQPIQFKV